MLVLPCKAREISNRRCERVHLHPPCGLPGNHSIFIIPPTERWITRVPGGRRNEVGEGADGLDFADKFTLGVSDMQLGAFEKDKEAVFKLDI